MKYHFTNKSGWKLHENKSKVCIRQKSDFHVYDVFRLDIAGISTNVLGPATFMFLLHKQVVVSEQDIKKQCLPCSFLCSKKELGGWKIT